MPIYVFFSYKQILVVFVSQKKLLSKKVSTPILNLFFLAFCLKDLNSLIWSWQSSRGKVKVGEGENLTFFSLKGLFISQQIKKIFPRSFHWELDVLFQNVHLISLSFLEERKVRIRDGPKNKSRKLTGISRHWRSFTSWDRIFSHAGYELVHN